MLLSFFTMESFPENGSSRSPSPVSAEGTTCQPKQTDDGAQKDGKVTGEVHFFTQLSFTMAQSDKLHILLDGVQDETPKLNDIETPVNGENSKTV